MRIDEKAYALKHPEQAAQLGIGAAGRRSKYGNKKTLYNGVLFDSKLEATCAAQLDFLIRTGHVLSWQGQVRYVVAAKITYVADFDVVYARGLHRVIDAKGAITDVFTLKAKLFLERYGYAIDVVKTEQEIPLEGR